MYNFLEYSHTYLKKSRNLWQYYRDKPALNDEDSRDNCPGNSALFKFKQKITGSRGDDDKNLFK